MLESMETDYMEIFGLEDFSFRAQNGMIICKELYLDFNEMLDDLDIKVLAMVLTSYAMPEYIRVNLDGKALSHTSVCYLIEAFKTIAPKKVELTCCHNAIEFNTLQEIISLLPFLLPESEIDLSATKIGDQGIKYIADGLQIPGIPKNLTIYSNENALTDIGVQSLLNAFYSGKIPTNTLVELDEENNISQECLDELEQTIKINNAMPANFAILQCVLFQKDIDKNLTPRLLKDIWAMIFCFAYPFEKANEEIKYNFAKNIYHFYFTPKRKDLAETQENLTYTNRL